MPVVVTCALRTPLCKARKGQYKDTSSDDLLIATFQAAREHIGIDPALVGDMFVLRSTAPLTTAASGQCSPRAPHMLPVLHHLQLGSVSFVVE